ncbi:MAG: hypothetical protein AAB777_02975 [Patescibacteria group bacterium]
MRILFVSRDNGGAKQSIPTTLLALERGHEVGLVLEGLAGDRFQDAGLFGSGSKAKLLFRGLENSFETPFSVEAGPVLKKFRPDVVVTTRSWPTSLESLFGCAANEVGIPLVLMEDFWNGHRSYLAKPNTIITLDEYAEKLVRRSHPSVRTVIAGNPGVMELDQIGITEEVRTRVEELRARFGRVFVFAGGNPQQMTVELQLLIECLKITKNWCLVSRPHPTIAKSEKEPGVKWSDFWNNMLKPFGEQIVSVECKMGESLASLADATFSGFSLMLNTAAYARRAAISLETEACARALSETVGLAEVPIVALGCAHTLGEPCDLDSRQLIRPADEANLAKLKPFAPAVAFGAIENLVQK